MEDVPDTDDVLKVCVTATLAGRALLVPRTPARYTATVTWVGASALMANASVTEGGWGRIAAKTVAQITALTM